MLISISPFEEQRKFRNLPKVTHLVGGEDRICLTVEDEFLRLCELYFTNREVSFLTFVINLFYYVWAKNLAYITSAFWNPFEVFLGGLVCDQSV